MRAALTHRIFRVARSSDRHRRSARNPTSVKASILGKLRRFDVFGNVPQGQHGCLPWIHRAEADVLMLQASKLLGHSTIEMTERYAHLAPENLRSAVAVLDGLRSDHVEARKVGSASGSR